MVAESPGMTVVVPTRGRPHRLGASLAALRRQTIAPTLEIIVVDDGSPSPEAVEEVVRRVGGVRLVRREAGGVGAARNTGTREASAQFVCFTDDDCEAAPDWAEKVRAAFWEGADAVAGLTLNGCPDNRFDEASQLGTNLLVEAMTTGTRTRYGAGSNLSSRTDVLLEIPFDERYRGSHEERDWCDRVCEAGYGLVWHPEAVVVHRQQLTWRTFLRKHVHYGRGAFTYRRLAAERHPMQPARFFGELIVAGFRRSPAIGLLVGVAQFASIVGFAREWAAVRAH
jgi:glycosyltransferase involved in cell wall biosynthesis